MIDCCIRNCEQSASKKHSFPSPLYNKEYFSKWIIAINDEKIKVMDPMKVYNEKKVCHNHFEDIYISKCGKLHKNAVPTLFLKGMTSENVFDLTDFNMICRVCLHKNIHLKRLDEYIKFRDKFIKPVKISDSLASIMKEISGDLDLPNKICIDCYEQLKHFEILKHNYLTSNDLLKIFILKTFEARKTKSFFLNENIKEILNGNIQENFNEVRNSVSENNKNLSIIEDSVTLKNKTVENNDSIIEILETESNIPTISEIKTQQQLHTCPICFKELTLRQYRPHIHKHKGLKKYLTGPKINKNVRFYTLPSNSISLVNEEPMLHECPFCTIKLNVSKFFNHVNGHLRNDQFKCDECERYFSRRRLLLQHKLIHKEELPYSCNVCNKKFVKKQNYECHLFLHSNDYNELPYVCKICDKRFYNPSHLRRHLIFHKESSTYSSKYKYERCHQCLQRFKKKEQIESHICNMIQKKESFCNHCKTSFSSSNLYYRHLKLKHNIVKKMNPDTLKKSLCSVCGLWVVNIYRHSFTHKSFKCHICLKNLNNPGALKKHLLIHSGIKPFLCSSCPKTFNSTYNLKVHERIHKGNKCHVCTVCQKGFLEKSYLNKHMKIHKL